MSTDKKKGDFHRTSSQEGEVGGNTKRMPSPRATAAPRTSKRTSAARGTSAGIPEADAVEHRSEL